MVFIGISSGGFASLLFGKILKVNKIISFSPQTNISKTFLNKINDKRFDKLLERNVYNPWNNKFYDINNYELHKNQEIIIIYSSINNLDKQHIRLIENSCNKIIDISNVPNNEIYSHGHKVAKFLKEEGLLNNILDEHV